jgi:hypothetical protein
MRLFLAEIYLLAALFTIVLNAQQDHTWKPLVVNENKKVWYDEANLSSVTGDKFEVWLLQMHIPPVTIKGLKEKVFRVMTLYAVDLSTVKYGIEKVSYFDENSKEISSYDYMIKNYEDDLKYTYPVLENSSIHLIIKELYKNRSIQ